MARAGNALRGLEVSNVHKVFYPKTRTTKGDVLKYYAQVAGVMVPHLKNRPITMIRFPNGVTGEHFYEKDAPGHKPAWVRTAPVERSEGRGFINYILVNDPRTLLWCANLASIEIHPFLHRAPRLDRPTHVAFDLDPGEGASLRECIEVAKLLRAMFERLKLEAWPKVSGSKGLQLYVPLNVPVTYDATKPFAKSVAELMQQRHPDLVVSDMAKALRKGKVLIDWSQNDDKKTTVGVYSLRAKREEPFVSMPVTWEELDRAQRRKDIDSLFFTPREAVARIEKSGDLFAPVLRVKQKLPPAFMKMAARDESRATTRTPSSLSAYAAKRDFEKTAEPPPAAPRRSRQGSRRRFVIQKHAASHLHYDFRLEMHDTLKSWAVPKGPPYATGVRRSAFQTEDHPIDYLDFEGTIPAGEYGGGTVMVWDIGTYDLIEGNYHGGYLKVFLAGRKLKGEWMLRRISREDEKPHWLLMKSGADMKPISARRDDESVLTKRTMSQIAKDKDAVWRSNR